jgi:hypothetical protein
MKILDAVASIATYELGEDGWCTIHFLEDTYVRDLSSQQADNPTLTLWEVIDSLKIAAIFRYIERVYPIRTSNGFTVFLTEDW